jgi:hypothetical protein
MSTTYDDPLKRPVDPSLLSAKTLRRKLFAKVIIEHATGKLEYEILQDDSVKDVINAVVKVSVGIS